MATTLLLPQDFKEFLRLLNEKAVEYLLVGGYAVGYYGYPRPTGDMDIWVAANNENAIKVIAALEDFGFASSVSVFQSFAQENNIIRLGFPPFRLEIITSIDGVSFSECYAQRTVTALDHIQVNVISLHHLKINKKASGRLKDLSDLENLP